jgi:hypothetical protein
MIGIVGGNMLSDILSIISKVVPNPSKAAQLKADIETSYNKALEEGIKANKEIILAESSSDSWLQRSWRPISALIVFTAIFVRFPLYHFLRMMVGWFDLPIYLPELEDLPQDFYMMATAFISIYAYGRTQEKRFKK